MKIRFNSILASLILAGLSVQSCGGSVDEPVQALEVTPLSIEADPQGGQEYVSVLSGEDWLIRSDKNWVKPSVSSGKGSSAAVNVGLTFEMNLEGAARTAVVTVKTLSGTTAEINIAQEPVGENVTARGISTADDLVAFAKAVNESASLTRFMENGVVVLLNDIDASSIKDWTPAGTAETPFTGVFNGRDFAIRNINWTVSDAGNAGIIGYAKDATVKNLTVGAEGDRITVSGDAAQVNAGAVAGYAEGGEITYCINNADVVYSGLASGADVCVAGICGRFMAGSGAKVSNCTNNGDVICAGVARAAGFVAYSEAEVTACTNAGCILADRSGEIGPAWGCSYSRDYASFTGNTGKGHVGEYPTYRDNPESAPSDAYRNAVASPATEAYDLEAVTISEKAESFYDWETVSTYEVSPGCSYAHYNCLNVPRHIHVLEIDLQNASLDLTTAYADDCIPNPNGNSNKNNGFKIRETLSQLCERKRAEGQNIVAGINTGFFDSNDGISRGFHVEEGQPVYINNPDVVNRLANHAWAFTVFTDGTASCGKKSFSGKIKVADKEFEYCSLNDTIMRHVSADYQVNLYNSRYKKQPHKDYPNLVNSLAADALYVIAEYEDSPMTVNTGYASAKVTAIHDGRSTALAEGPYITSDRQIGIALSGSTAASFAELVSVGTTLQLRCDIEVEGETTRPIYTQNSTMYRVMQDGKDNTSSISSSNTFSIQRDPLTFPVVSKDASKIWLVEVDGRQDWYSIGITAYELYRIAEKLGGYNVTRFDGGGSSAMWIYDSAAGKGGLVNSVSDSKGERSCMNYILIRTK